MEVKVYQIVASRDGSSCSFNLIGTVTGESPDPETIWHLTNHGCWNGKEDEDGNTVDGEYYPIASCGCTYEPTSWDRGYTNDDICFEMDGRWLCAKSSGWKEVRDIEEAKRYLFENAFWVRNTLPSDFQFGSVEDTFR